MHFTDEPPPRHATGYFSHHGWLAPGIKLFRKLGFPAKSAWMLGAMLETGKLATIDQERQGLRYVNGVSGLARELFALRAAAMAQTADLKPQQSAAEAAFATLQQLEKELGPVFGNETQTGFEALRKSVQDVLQNPVRAS